MDPIVKYPDFTQLDALSTPLREYARLKCEQGAETGAAALIGQLDVYKRQGWAAPAR